jgi:hypothetical protein
MFMGCINNGLLELEGQQRRLVGQLPLVFEQLTYMVEEQEGH